MQEENRRPSERSTPPPATMPSTTSGSSGGGSAYGLNANYEMRLKSPSVHGRYRRGRGTGVPSTSSPGPFFGASPKSGVRSSTRSSPGLLSPSDRASILSAHNVAGGGNENLASGKKSGGKKMIYSDRFIPSRAGSQLGANFALASGITPNDEASALDNGSAPNGGREQSETKKEEGFATYTSLLRSELLGIEVPSPRNDSSSAGGTPRGMSSPTRCFRFRALQEKTVDARVAFSLSPLGSASQHLLSSPRKVKRKIAKVPFKVLDAPALQDDFYLNLVDWSVLNSLAVGLGNCVYLWSACTSKVTKLCDLGDGDSVTSVAWTARGTHLAVGTNSGEVQIWDAARGDRCSKVRTMGGHSMRVGTMAWSNNLLASGSRDRVIYLRDVRASEPYSRTLTGHKQEVCGLKWSFDCQQLASGGNDNKLFVWNAQQQNPVLRFTEHKAAVKALAWSPHQHGLLSSGGGTADRCIRFWNTLTGSPLNCIDTGSQVCNLMWSKNVNEIVSTHGYSLNQIIVWRYPNMSKIATLTGHTLRVLYLAMSPDGQTVVTGAGDETLRFWNVFPGPKNKSGSRLGTSLLFPAGANIR